MATAQTAKTAEKTKRLPVSMAARVTTQLDRAAMGRKISAEELEAIRKRVEVLKAFVEGTKD